MSENPEDLSRKTCKPCEAGQPPLSPAQAEAYLRGVSGWQSEESKKLKKDFRFPDFKGALAFADKIGALAEKEGHHPTLLVSYGRVRVTLTTHAIGGLSENDFILAAKIDRL